MWTVLIEFLLDELLLAVYLSKRRRLLGLGVLFLLEGIPDVLKK
jgi:hypothetical protein